jgi:hypothetical protein
LVEGLVAAQLGWEAKRSSTEQEEVDHLQGKIALGRFGKTVARCEEAKLFVGKIEEDFEGVCLSKAPEHVTFCRTDSLVDGVPGGSGYLSDLDLVDNGRMFLVVVRISRPLSAQFAKTSLRCAPVIA